MKHRGLAQIPLMIGLLLMAVALPVATKLVQDNQDNRNKAAVQCEYDDDCGPYGSYKCENGTCVKNAGPTANPSGRYGCSKDTDCSQGNVCVAGRCIVPTSTCDDDSDCDDDAHCVDINGGEHCVRCTTFTYGDRGAGGCTTNQRPKMCGTNVVSCEAYAAATAVPTSSPKSCSNNSYSVSSCRGKALGTSCSEFLVPNGACTDSGSGDGAGGLACDCAARPPVLKNLCDAGDSCVKGTAWNCVGGVTYGNVGVCEVSVGSNGTCCKMNAPTIAPGATCSNSGGTCMTLELRKTKDCTALVFGKEFSDCESAYQTYYDCCKTLVAKPTPTDVSCPASENGNPYFKCIGGVLTECYASSVWTRTTCPADTTCNAAKGICEKTSTCPLISGQTCSYASCDTIGLAYGVGTCSGATSFCCKPKPTSTVKPTLKPTATPAVGGSSCYCVNACYTGASCAYTSYMPAPYVKCPTNSFCTIPSVKPTATPGVGGSSCYCVNACYTGASCAYTSYMPAPYVKCPTNSFCTIPSVTPTTGVVLPYTTTVPGKCANSDPCTLPIVAEKCAEQCCGTGHYYYNSEHKKYYCGTEPGPTGTTTDCTGKIAPPDQCPVPGNPNQLGVNASCITLNGQKIWDWDLKLCDQKGKTSACGIRNYCCPSVGGNWTTDMTQCPVTCTQCAGKPEAKGKGDADCSGTTDINDASIWRSEFTSGQLGTEVSNSWRADFDCDGKVTLNDISIWRENFIKGLTN